MCSLSKALSLSYAQWLVTVGMNNEYFYSLHFSELEFTDIGGFEK